MNLKIREAIDELKQERREIDNLIAELERFGARYGTSRSNTPPANEEPNKVNTQTAKSKPNGKTNGDAPLTCIDCGKTFKGEGWLARHRKQCQPAPEDAEPERRASAKPRSLYAPERANGAGVVCIEADCGLSFPNARELGLHKTREHFAE